MHNAVYAKQVKKSYLQIFENEYAERCSFALGENS